MDSNTQQPQTRSTQLFRSESENSGDTQKVYTPFNSFNQQQYQKEKYEQVTYTFAGKITNVQTVGASTVDLSNTARVFFIAKQPLTVTKALCAYQQKDSAAYIVLKKLTNTEDYTLGYVLLPEPFDCTLPENVTQIRNLYDFVPSVQDRALNTGDRLAIDFPVTPDTLADITLTIEYKY